MTSLLSSPDPCCSFLLPFPATPPSLPDLSSATSEIALAPHLFDPPSFLAPSVEHVALPLDMVASIAATSGQTQQINVCPSEATVAMASQDPPIFQEQSHLSTPTMHPNLVSTLKSIICPPPSPPLRAQSVECCTLLQCPVVRGDRNAKQKQKQKQAAIVPIHLIQNRRPYKCSYGGCAKTFKNPQTLKMHHKTHCSSAGGGRKGSSSDVTTTPYSLSTVPASCKAGQNKKIPSRCPVCKRAFVGLYELRRHFGRKHSVGEKSHACSKCGKRFYIEVDLRDHQKLCGEPLLCRCGIKFAFKCNLVAHKKTHPACQDLQQPPPSSAAHHPFLTFLSSSANAYATSPPPPASTISTRFSAFHKSPPLQRHPTPLAVSRAV